jgi:hypothetical protein
MTELCEHCHVRPPQVVEMGPMIWMRQKNGELKGLYRPRKDLCLDCTQLPTETVWPVVSPLDCRREDLA